MVWPLGLVIAAAFLAGCDPVGTELDQPVASASPRGTEATGVVSGVLFADRGGSTYCFFRLVGDAKTYRLEPVNMDEGLDLQIGARIKFRYYVGEFSSVLGDIEVLEPSPAPSATS